MQMILGFDADEILGRLWIIFLTLFSFQKFVRLEILYTFAVG